jgi:hypothetical protein
MDPIDQNARNGTRRNPANVEALVPSASTKTPGAGHKRLYIYFASLARMIADIRVNNAG